MKKERCHIKFLPEDKSVEVKSGTTILEAAHIAGVYINSACGGDHICGKCRVKIKKGHVNSPPTNLLSLSDIKSGYVLACQAQVTSDAVAEIPAEASPGQAKIVVDGKQPLYSRIEGMQSTEQLEKKLVFETSPLVRKIFLKLPQPDRQNNISDLERIYREIRKVDDIKIMQTGLKVIREIASLVRNSNWEITVTLGRRNGTTEVIQVEPGDTSSGNFGVAVDVGTTTVVASLVNLNTGEVLGAKGTYNKQISYGEDVISRIIYASEKTGLERLELAVVENINSLIESLASADNLKLSDITAVQCAGNTTMTHLLMGIMPDFIRRDPYVPAATCIPAIRAAEVGIRINPRGILSCVPGVASYVGGDVVAGVLASGMAESDELSLFIDMGTNGELVLGNREWFTCCACSAGPAFEGSGIKSGMRARNGAIEKIDIRKNLEPEFTVIGNVRPHGICGAGLLDLMGEMLARGIIDRAGQISRTSKNPRIRKGEAGFEYVLVWKKDSDGESDIAVTQSDIDNLIKAKAAIYAGAAIMLKRMNFSFDRVMHYYIGGAFGAHLDIEKAIRFGLLPDLKRDSFLYLGNSSLTGARQCLLSQEAREKVHRFARMMTSFELSIEPGYMEEYVAAFFLPHTDLTKFPTVKAESGAGVTG